MPSLPEGGAPVPRRRRAASSLLATSNATGRMSQMGKTVLWAQHEPAMDFGSDDMTWTRPVDVVGEVVQWADRLAGRAA